MTLFARNVTVSGAFQEFALKPISHDIRPISTEFLNHSIRPSSHDASSLLFGFARTLARPTLIFAIFASFAVLLLSGRVRLD